MKIYLESLSGEERKKLSGEKKANLVTLNEKKSRDMKSAGQ